MKFIRSIPLWFWLLIVSIVPLLSLLTPGLPITHDGPDHVARIANFYRALSEGIIVPRWASDLNWGYGHPILMFLYPLPSYIASFFHFIGFSFVDSTKVVFGSTFVASIIAMYVWLKEEVNDASAFVGAILYGFAPYRFVDLYVRGALGEHVAFVFPPLVCYFLHRVSKENRNNQRILFGIGLSFSFAGLLLAHNAIALMCLPLFILYGAYLLSFEAKDKLRFIMYSKIFFLLGFGLSAFFWIPAFFEGKYTLRDIVTAGEVLDRFVPWTHFLYSPWSYGGTDLLSKSLGFGALMILIVSIYTQFTVEKKRHRVLLMGSMIVFLCTLFLMTSQSRVVWTWITLLQKFQFPWRFLTVTTFLISVMGAFALQAISTKVGKSIFEKVSIGFCALIILSTVGMWHPKAYEQRDESKFTGIYHSTTDTGESSPIWSIRFMEHTPDSDSSVINGEASIKTLNRSTTLHSYTIFATTSARILENTLYFPGWNVYVNGQKTAIQFQDPEYRGLMTYEVPKGNISVLIQFEDTKIRMIANLITGFSLFLAGCLSIVPILWKKTL